MARNTAASSSTGGQYTFSRAPQVQIPRSRFNRSFGHKTTFDAGGLYPIFADEALPGDTFNLRVSSFCRFNTPIYPVLDNMFMDFFFFAVPNRLVWVNWQKFCGEQTDPGDSTDYTVPTCSDTSMASNEPAAMMGVPYGQGTVVWNALFTRAYNLIYNEWFRDENLVDSVICETDDGPDLATAGYNDIHKRAKRHDYFSSCLPWRQKGDPVSLPLGTSAPVVPETGSTAPLFDNPNWTENDLPLTSGAGTGTSNANWAGQTSATPHTAYWSDPGLEADLTNATAATINDIREAFQVQRLLEKDARGGTRYTEIIRSHFGVTSPDQRLQRPEYLGGGTTRVNVHAVAATADTGSYNPGDLAAFGVAAQDGIGFVKSFTEHCIVIGIVNVRADVTYQNGMNKMFSRQTRYDYYWPSLAHLGEQAVLQGEIFWDGGTPANNDIVFGYQERYAEYRYKPSYVSGKMHSNEGSSLDPWHLALDFDTAPLLNQTFIEDNPPINRVVAVETEPDFLGDFYFSYSCARPMPTFSVPGLIDHF